MVWETTQEQHQLMESMTHVTAPAAGADEDWGELANDWDGDFYEQIAYPPDDDDGAPDTEPDDYYDCSVTQSASYSTAKTSKVDFRMSPRADKVGNEEMRSGATPDSHRRDRIIEWLANSPFARQFRTRKGFYVRKGMRVRLQSGVVLELLDWLDEEGIWGGLTLAGYDIVHSTPQSKYGERLSFFANTHDAPFDRRQRSTS